MTGGVVIKNYPTTFAFYGHFSGNPSLTSQDYDTIADAVGDDGLSVFLGNGVFEGNLNAQNAIADNFRARGYAAATTQVPGAHDGMTAGQLFTIFARDHLWSGVDSVSVTPATVNLTKGWNWDRQFTAQVTTNEAEPGGDVVGPRERPPPAPPSPRRCCSRSPPRRPRRRSPSWRRRWSIRPSHARPRSP